MKIKLNQASAGPKGSFPAGKIIEVDSATGKYLIDSRQGVEVPESFPEPVASKADGTVETATVPDTSETADWPRRRRGRPSNEEKSKDG